MKSAWTNSTRSIVAVVVLTASIACQKHYPPFPRAAEHKIAAFLADSEPSPPAYDSLFVYFVEGWETYQEPEGTRARYPGLPSRHGAAADGMEGFARISPLVATWLQSGRIPRVAMSDGRVVDLTQLIRRGLINGTDPNRVGYWGDITDLNQRICEASDVALVVWLTRKSIWPTLSQHQKANVVAWLNQVNGKKIPDSNWHLFPTFVNIVLHSLGEPADIASAEANYRRFKTFYRGDGWFSDGPGMQFDYYNGWGIHYQLYWIQQVDPTWDAAFIQDAQNAFVSRYKYLFGPSGLPILGRSICYRMAAPAPLVFGSTTDPTQVSPAEAKRALDVVWRYFLQRGAVRGGNVTQGYCGTDPRVLDNYSGAASCLWALRSLIVAYYLPPDAAFWHAPGGKLPIELADVDVAIPAIGWRIEGLRDSGFVDIHTSQSATEDTSVIGYGPIRKLAGAITGKPFRPANQGAKYERRVYSGGKPFCGCVRQSSPTSKAGGG